LDGTLIPQTVTHTDNVTVQNNNGEERDSSGKENTKLMEGLNSTEFLLTVDHFYNFAIYTAMNQRF
jgi:hypothetical protein